jgi:GxxExxY protein
MDENELSREVIGCAIEVHRNLRPGWLESAYEECLAAELQGRNLHFHRQMPVPLVYRDIRLECGYRLDFLVEQKLIVEVKALEVVPPVAYAQLLTYLRLRDVRLGLLINFNVEQLKLGIKRVVNGLK